jgi:hypothetical protein
LRKSFILSVYFAAEKMPNKPMKNSIAAAAANNTHTHPLKGGGVVFAACSTREDRGHIALVKNLGVHRAKLI